MGSIIKFIDSILAKNELGTIRTKIPCSSQFMHKVLKAFQFKPTSGRRPAKPLTMRKCLNFGASVDSFM